MKERLEKEIKFRLTPSMREALEEEADREHLSVSDLVRRIVDRYLQEHDAAYRRVREEGVPYQTARQSQSQQGKPGMRDTA